VRPSQGLTKVKRGGAAMALPLLLCLGLGAAGLRANVTSLAPAPLPTEDGHVDAGARLLDVNPSVFNGLSDRLGMPDTGGTLLLWGGGATIVPGKLRAQASGWSGGLSASQGTRQTTWDLDLAAFSLEERYPFTSYEITAGTSLEYGRLMGGMDDYSAGNLNRVEANLWGTSVSAGFRWPTQTAVGFFVRTQWLWLQGDGTWHGSSASSLGSTHFDLGGPSVTAQIEMSL